MMLNKGQLTKEELSFSNALHNRIVDAIDASGGKISFARYMELALYSPGLGYYCNGLIKFGPKGDFITAPELSPLFGECIAASCVDVMAELDTPCLLEFGAGSGKLAATILTSLAKRHAMPHRYYIVELSAELKMRQQMYFKQHAPELLNYIEWLTRLPSIPFEGVVIANEVLDAMPVHKFQQADTLQEVYVTHQAGQLGWVLDTPSTSRLTDHVTRLGVDFSKGYCSEVNLMIDGWIKSISHFLGSGLVLIIDYGFLRGEYYHPQRSEGTIMCHYRHQAHTDPLVLPGLQDITAHVDFSHVCDAAVESGLTVASYMDQANFLIDAGLLSIAQSYLDEEDPVSCYKISQQIKQLTLPSEMGTLFKVLCLTKR